MTAHLQAAARDLHAILNNPKLQEALKEVRRVTKMSELQIILAILTNLPAIITLVKSGDVKAIVDAILKLLGFPMPPVPTP